MDNNNGFDELEFKSWTRKIDAIYSSVIKAQECYFGLESKEKILAVREKQKSHAKDSKKALSNIDPNKVAEVSNFFSCNGIRFISIFSL